MIFISNIATQLVSILGNTLLQRNTSTAFYTDLPEKLFFLMPNVLNTPLIAVWHQLCYKCSSAVPPAKKHRLSMMPSSAEQISLIKQFSNKMEWTVIAVMYAGMYMEIILGNITLIGDLKNF